MLEHEKDSRSLLMAKDGLRQITPDKSAVKITVTYDDGSTEDLEKGMIWSLIDEPGTEQIKVIADMVAMSGQDIYTIVKAAVELGLRLGMFRGLEDDDD